MSGPYDDDRSRRPPPTLSHSPSGAYGNPTLDDPPTRTSTRETLEPHVDERSQQSDELYLPAPAVEPGKEHANAPIVQAGSVTGKSLTLVIAIMCFLACLTAGAVYLINQSANAWLRDISTEVTVQVDPSDDPKATEQTVKGVVDLLVIQPGVLDVRILDSKESARLLEPWLGASKELANLPIPRLIAIELDRNVEPDFTGLNKTLEERFPTASLDDHRHWQNQIRTVTRSFAIGGIAILLLVGAATTAIIVSATRSAMASNREIVEVLHFVGATDRFIAREFEKHFLTLGIRAGVVGAFFAMAVFFLMPTLMEFLAGGTVTLAEFKRLVGTGVLDAPGYLLLALVVVVIAALCMLTSRFGVFRILNSQS